MVLAIAPSPTITGVKVRFDGKSIPFNQSAPIMEQGVVLVSMRDLAKAIDADVAFNVTTNQAVFHRDGHSLYLTQGKTFATTEYRRDVHVDAAPKVVNGLLYVPLRFTVEALGLDSKWKSGSVEITSDAVDSDISRT